MIEAICVAVLSVIVIVLICIDVYLVLKVKALEKFAMAATRTMGEAVRFTQAQAMLNKLLMDGQVEKPAPAEPEPCSQPESCIGFVQ